MGTGVDDPDTRVGISRRAAEDNSCSVGGPRRVVLFLVVFVHHFARRAPLARNRIDLGLLSRQKTIEHNLPAIGRPARQHGNEGRVSKLNSLAAVQLASPECALREPNISHPLTIFREADAVRGNPGKQWNELGGLRVVTNQLTARQRPHHE